MTYETATATCNVNYWQTPLIISKSIPQEEFITAQDVINAGCNAFNIKKLDLFSGCRKRKLVTARDIIMYVIRMKVKVLDKKGERIKISFKAIGDLFNRDHTSALHAIRKIYNDLSIPAYRQETNELIMSVIKYL